jgi:hypothetical protein
MEMAANEITNALRADLQIAEKLFNCSASQSANE